MKLLLCLLLLSYVSCEINQQKFRWGTYKPQLIHGVSERNLNTFNPLTVTFYYFLNQHVNWERSIKYKMSEVTDKESYSFLEHDAEKFAIHEIQDKEYNLGLRNDFFKISPETSEDWFSETSNINALNGDDEKVSVVYSFALEKLNSAKTDLRKFTIAEDGSSLRIDLNDLNSETSYIYISLMVDGVMESIPGNQNFGFHLMNQNPSLNWNCRPALYQELRKSQHDSLPYKLGYNISSQEQGNLLFIQYVGRRNQDFHVQVLYASSQLTFSNNGYYYDSRNLKRLTLLNFNSRFQRTFYNKETSNLSPVILVPNTYHLECAKSAFSNLMGGYILAYGDLYCESNEEPCNQARMMLTMTPARSNFPRPFLWDDGFHNMIACKWNPMLCLQTLSDWFGTMTDDGWIPREQARGDELRSYFPPVWNGFQLKQQRQETNPPTFLFDLLSLDSKANSVPEIYPSIKKLWPKLIKWYNFWFKSQGVFNKDSTDQSFLFKWWGPNEDINFGSGMDDWPRTIQGHVGKYNIDASMWGWFFADSMEKLSRVYEPQKTDQFRLIAESIKKSINEYLLDPSDNIYKDLLVGNQPRNLDQTQHSPHIGYPNLLPLAFGFIDDRNTAVLDAYLDLIESPKLWTQYGIRSLSKTDEYFGKVGDNYWRGPIWININYLVLRGLQKYYRSNERAMKIYKELRQNIVGNVCQNWRDTGFFYEHYNARLDGQGRGVKPFNGWTSLVTLIVTENYD